MPKTFLGKGWSFPIALDDSHAIEMAEYEESVRQSVWNILGTAKGERVMRPDFGCGIYDLVFEVNSASTAGKVAQEVKESLLLFEPRIDVRDIQVQPGDSSELLMISIEYEVRATNNMFNLVYPFYLQRSTQ
jgi:phage baseplate assembly protein W